MPYPNGQGAGGGRRTFTPIPESPFANTAARDTWGRANGDMVRNSPEIVTELMVGGTLYRWSGADKPSQSVYDSTANGAWVIASSSESAGARTDFASFSDRDTYYQVATNRVNLTEGLPIRVTTSPGVVSFFEYTGKVANPPTYNSGNWGLVAGQWSPNSSRVGSRSDSNGGDVAQWTNEGTGDEYFYVHGVVPTDANAAAGDLLHLKLAAQSVVSNQVAPLTAVSVPDADGVTRYVLPNADRGRNESFSYSPNNAGVFSIELRLGGPTGEPVFEQVVTASASDAAVFNIDSISQAVNAVIGVVGHDYQVGDVFLAASVEGMTEVNGLPMTVTAVTTNTVTVDQDTTGFTAYTAAGVGMKQRFVDLANPLYLLTPGQLIYVSLTPAEGSAIAFRGAQIGSPGAFVPHLQTKTRLITELKILDSGNAGEIINSLSGDNRVSYNSLRDIPAPNGGSVVQRPLQVFNDSVTVTAANLADYANRNNVYGARNDKVVNFRWPLPSELQPTDYPLEMEVQHLGGTLESNRLNRVNFDTQSGDSSVIVGNGVRNVQFIDLLRGQTLVARQESAGADIIVQTSSIDPRSSVLPSGAFNLRTQMVDISGRTSAPNPPVFSGLGGVVPSKGDAFEVLKGGDSFGYEVEDGDVLVAKVDNPSLAINTSNDDWLLIRDVRHFLLTLSVLRFLAQLREGSTPVDTPALDDPLISRVNVYLSPFILDHNPFLTPSTDPNNPQSGGVNPYIGGDEGRTTDHDFAIATNAPHTLVYIGISRGLSSELVSTINIVHIDIDGNEIERYNLGSQFTKVAPDGNAANDPFDYFVLDRDQSGSFSEINFSSGQSIDVVVSGQNRRYTFSDQVDVTGAVNNLLITQLESNAQALLTEDHSLSALQESLLSSITSTTVSSAIPDDTAIFVKDSSASGGNNLGHYRSIEQGDGVLPNFTGHGVRPVTFLVDKRVTVNGLQKVNSIGTKLAVTRVGVILDRQAFSANLPESSDIANNAWQIDGSLNTSTATGFIDSVKTRTVNYTDDSVTLQKLSEAVRQSINSGGSPDPLPQNLVDIDRDVTITHTPVSGWRDIPDVVPFTVTREFSACFGEDLRTTNGVNRYTDVGNASLVGFTGSSVQVYTDSTRVHNRTLPSVDSFIRGDTFGAANNAGQNVIQADNNKLGNFSFSSLQVPAAGVDHDVLRFGVANHPIMTFSHQYALAVEVGDGQGVTRSRTFDDPLTVVGNTIHGSAPIATYSESQIQIPTSVDGVAITGSTPVKVVVELDDNGTASGNPSQTVTIADVTVDQIIGPQVFTYSGFGNFTLTFRYVAATRTLFADPGHAENNPALTWIISASLSITETWSENVGYSKVAINGGDAHGPQGLFNPELWHTARVGAYNPVSWLTMDYRYNDSSPDPEQLLLVVVDGDHGDDFKRAYAVRTRRPKSHFDFQTPLYSSSALAMGEIIMTRWAAASEAQLPTLPILERLADKVKQDFGLATNRSETIDNIKFKASVEVEKLITTDTMTGQRRQLTLINGVWTEGPVVT